MQTFLEIAVNVPQVTGVFHYHLPPELEGQVGPGHLVEVPFGAQKVQGVVLRKVDTPDVAETKGVAGLVDPQPVLTTAQLALAQQLSEKYLAPLAACIGLMIPSGLNQQADMLYNLCAEPAALPTEGLSPLEKKLAALLSSRGASRARQIDKALPKSNWRAAMRSLVRKNIARGQSILPAPSVQPKSVRTVQLACPPDQVESILPDLGRKDSEALRRRQAMLSFLLREPGPVEAAWVYAESGGNRADLQVLAERGLVLLDESEVWRDPLAQLEVIPADAPDLLPDQAAAWREIKKGLRAGKPPALPYLLQGVTGSGKTEIYLRAAEEVLQQGRQAIILVPEIALTPQTVRRFLARFPGRVGLVHSGLSTGERYDTWRRARAGLISLVVGPRSALFTPFANLGLVVVDEFHDDSYYQPENPPYHAREAAIAYARLAGALCLLGSASPDLVTRYRALQEGWPLLSLSRRILGHRQVLEAAARRTFGGEPEVISRYKPAGAQAETIDLPPVQIVDMRQELKAGNRSIFSRSLQASLGKVLEEGQQAILFLNRRGTSTYVFCRDCGFVLKCPRCDLPLTYHSAGPAAGLLQGKTPNLAASPAGAHQPGLVCHHCNYRRKLPHTCPQCGSARIRQFGTGTESVEAEVQAMFPAARTLRWDYETTRQKGAHEIILSHFANHRADVLIGTQMVAKGLDLPRVTLVGVVLADIGLNLPDYRASERTFQVLMQVSGRAGRSPLGGQVILQTFQPDNYVIQAAAKHDYQGFYEKELLYRKQIGYPPFSRLVRLEYADPDRQKAEGEARRLAAQLRTWISQADRRATELIGPAPCFFSRVGGLYRWQIVVRGPNPASLLKNRPLEGWRLEVDPISLL